MVLIKGCPSLVRLNNISVIPLLLDHRFQTGVPLFFGSRNTAKFRNELENAVSKSGFLNAGPSPCLRSYIIRNKFKFLKIGDACSECSRRPVIRYVDDMVTGRYGKFALRSNVRKKCQRFQLQVTSPCKPSRRTLSVTNTSGKSVWLDEATLSSVLTSLHRALKTHLRHAQQQPDSSSS